MYKFIKIIIITSIWCVYLVDKSVIFFSISVIAWSCILILSFKDTFHCCVHTFHIFNLCHKCHAWSYGLCFILYILHEIEQLFLYPTAQFHHQGNLHLLTKIFRVTNLTLGVVAWALRYITHFVFSFVSESVLLKAFTKLDQVFHYWLLTIILIIISFEESCIFVECDGSLWISVRRKWQIWGLWFRENSLNMIHMKVGFIIKITFDELIFFFFMPVMLVFDTCHEHCYDGLHASKCYLE